MDRKTLAIIGGGASGTAAAIEAAQIIGENKNICVVIYERLPKIGKKLLATGNGRCNIMNRSASPEMYSGDKKLLSGIFSMYPPQSNIEFFRKMGLLLTDEEAGRMYPMSFQASSVLDALRFELQKNKTKIVCDTKIETIKHCKDHFLLNDDICADAVVVAGGGKSSSVQGSDGSCFELLRSLGIKILPVFPSLTGIVLKKKNKALKGTRAKGEILIVENGKVISVSKGELQYTDYGISGIPAMEVSRAVSEHFALHKKGKIVMSVNSLPDFSPDEIFEYIVSRKKNAPDLLCENLLSGVMPKKLGIAKLEGADIDINSPLSSLTKSKIAALTEIINSDIFDITGTLGFDSSQVTAGGADTKFFNMQTLEAKNIPGLFACGEVLNADGRCGGYNLGWAWSSGRCAGRAAAEYLISSD